MLLLLCLLLLGLPRVFRAICSPDWAAFCDLFIHVLTTWTFNTADYLDAFFFSSFSSRLSSPKNQSTGFFSPCCPLYCRHLLLAVISSSLLTIQPPSCSSFFFSLLCLHIYSERLHDFDACKYPLLFYIFSTFQHLPSDMSMAPYVCRDSMHGDSLCLHLYYTSVYWIYDFIIVLFT